jgi:hypothetical protein
MGIYGSVGIYKSTYMYENESGQGKSKRGGREHEQGRRGHGVSKRGWCSTSTCTGGCESVPQRERQEQAEAGMDV